MSCLLPLCPRGASPAWEMGTNRWPCPHPPYLTSCPLPALLLTVTFSVSPGFRLCPHAIDDRASLGVTGPCGQTRVAGFPGLLTFRRGLLGREGQSLSSSCHRPSPTPTASAQGPGHRQAPMPTWSGLPQMTPVFWVSAEPGALCWRLLLGAGAPRCGGSSCPDS